MPMTAHDLAADGADGALYKAYGFRVKGGRVVWEEADYPRGGWEGENVRIWRVVGDGNGVRAVVRYVDPMTEVTLVLLDPNKEKQ